MVTDHKNLEYFMSSKKLSRHQARWAKFLGQFNMKVQFRLGRLGSKLDTLTHRWDIYTEGDNPEPAATNIHPVFTIKQLTGTPVSCLMVKTGCMRSEEHTSELQSLTN